LEETTPKDETIKADEAVLQKTESDVEARQRGEEEVPDTAASDGIAIVIQQEADHNCEFADASDKDKGGEDEAESEQEEAEESRFDKDFESGGLLSEDTNLSKQAKRISLLLHSIQDEASGERRLSKRDLLMDDDDDLEEEMERLNLAQVAFHTELNSLKIPSIHNPDASPTWKHLKKTVQSTKLEAFETNCPIE
jgi:hypothetical protein